MHKVSKSRSTKNFETSPNNNSKENQQSTALQKKRERYHSQRRKGAPNPNYDCLGMNIWLKTHLTKFYFYLISCFYEKGIQI